MIVEQRDWDCWASKPLSQCHQCQSSALVFLFLVLIVIYNHAYITSLSYPHKIEKGMNLGIFKKIAKHHEIR